jgi:hypothetical protein
MSITFIFRFFAAASWMLVCIPSLTAAATSTCPPLAVEAHTQSMEHGPALRFFEKTALKIAARKLRKALQKQDWADIQGDSAAPCGQILLRSGRVIDAELTDITPTEVKYRPCGQPDYPKFVLSKKDVLRVVSADWKDQYKDVEQMKKNTEKTSNTGAADHKMAIASAIFGAGAALVGLLIFQSLGLAFLLALTAIVLGSISLQAIKKRPEKHKGRQWAIVGLILGGLMFLGTLLALAEGT